MRLPKNLTPPKLYEDEALFESWVRERLSKIPYSYWLPKSHPFYKRGLPDVIGCIAGHFVAMELKAENAKPDPSRELLQEYEVMQMRGAGARAAYFRVCPSDWMQIEEFLYSLVGEDFEKSLSN